MELFSVMTEDDIQHDIGIQGRAVMIPCLIHSTLCNYATARVYNLQPVYKVTCTPSVDEWQ